METWCCSEAGQECVKKSVSLLLKSRKPNLPNSFAPPCVRPGHRKWTELPSKIRSKACGTPWFLKSESRPNVGSTQPNFEHVATVPRKTRQNEECLGFRLYPNKRSNQFQESVPLTLPTTCVCMWLPDSFWVAPKRNMKQCTGSFLRMPATDLTQC